MEVVGKCVRVWGDGGGKKSVGKCGRRCGEVCLGCGKCVGDGE